MLWLPYGRAPYPLELGDRAFSVVAAPQLPPPPDLAELLDRALATPIDSAPLEVCARGAQRITIVISDATRDEPRDAILDAVFARLPSDAVVTLAIATGTHGRAPLAALGIDRFVPRATLVNHDGHDPADLVHLGATPRGTPVVVHRCLLDADLVVATGCIRPHYFAGFGAGSKALFPGLGEASAIRQNHRLKQDPRARAGAVDDNPCRLDLEDAARLIPTPSFLLDGIVAADDRIHAAVAGDLFAAFRAGCHLARPWFTARAKPAPLVVASDALPVTASLYQAAKIAAAVAPLVAEDGKLVLVAECPDGTGPLEVVNEAIFRIGVLPRLARGVSLHLVSSLAPGIVARTLLAPAASVDQIVTQSGSSAMLVVPRASHLLCEVLP